MLTLGAHLNPGSAARAGPAAAAVDKAEADVLGIATALNNLQNASPAFTVRVDKK